jgi:hypothetical protein
MVGLTAMAARLDEEAHAGLMMRLAAARSWRRPGGQQACQRGTKSRRCSAAAGEEEQAMQRFFGIADLVAAGDENF